MRKLSKASPVFFARKFSRAGLRRSPRRTQFVAYADCSQTILPHARRAGGGIDRRREPHRSLQLQAVAHRAAAEFGRGPLATDFRTGERDLAGRRQIVGTCFHRFLALRRVKEYQGRPFSGFKPPEGRARLGILERLSALVGGKLEHTLDPQTLRFCLDDANSWRISRYTFVDDGASFASDEPKH